MSGKTGTVSNLTIGGQPVDIEKIYHICTNDFVLGVGDGYKILTKNAGTFNSSMLLSDVVIEYVRAQKSPVMPVLDGRIHIIDEK